MNQYRFYLFDSCPPDIRALYTMTRRPPEKDRWLIDDEDWWRLRIVLETQIAKENASLNAVLEPDFNVELKLTPL